MENASKALLIAAGILIGLILITMIIYGYSQISSYYKAKEENREIEQLVDFNKQYIPYNRDDVRGSDLLSLVNKIIDYNVQKTDNMNEENIDISIKINNIKDFYYKYDENKRVTLIKANYTQDNINNDLIKPANEIESDYPQGMATKLAANMSTLMGENSLKSKKDLLVELKIMDKDDRNPDDFVNNNDILKYYQYQQFKRAHFNCKNLTYNEQGRVKSFTFEFNGKFE